METYDRLMVGGVSGLIGLEHLGFFSLFLISCVCTVFYKNMVKKNSPKSDTDPSANINKKKTLQPKLDIK